MGELWPGQTVVRLHRPGCSRSVLPFVDNACAGPYLRMGPAGPAVPTAPLRAGSQYFLHRACTWIEAGIEAGGRRGSGLWSGCCDRRPDCRAGLRSVPEVQFRWSAGYLVPVPGEPVPGEPVPGEPVPGEPVPGELIPREAIPGKPAPGAQIPGVSSSRGTV